MQLCKLFKCYSNHFLISISISDLEILAKRVSVLNAVVHGQMIHFLPTIIGHPSKKVKSLTGVMLNPVPGPRTHDGILAQSQDEEETAKTYNLIEEHVAGEFLP